MLLKDELNIWKLIQSVDWLFSMLKYCSLLNVTEKMTCVGSRSRCLIPVLL